MSISSLSVTTRNAVNIKTMEIQRRIIEILAPYVGKKVRKVSGYGGWIVALDRELNDFYDNLNAEGFHCWICCRFDWASLEVKSTFKCADLMGGGHAVEYVKASISLAKITGENGTLVEIFKPAILRTDYTLDWVEATRKQAAKLEDQARELRSQLREFN
jgi:hypothetical protein